MNKEIRKSCLDYLIKYSINWPEKNAVVSFSDAYFGYYWIKLPSGYWILKNNSINDSITKSNLQVYLDNIELTKIRNSLPNDEYDLTFKYLQNKNKIHLSLIDFNNNNPELRLELITKIFAGFCLNCSSLAIFNRNNISSYCNCKDLNCDSKTLMTPKTYLGSNYEPASLLISSSKEIIKKQEHLFYFYKECEFIIEKILNIKKHLK